MYFPLFKLQVWNKRFADQPQTNYSEVPWLSPDRKPQKPVQHVSAVGDEHCRDPHDKELGFTEYKGTAESFFCVCL